MLVLPGADGLHSLCMHEYTYIRHAHFSCFAAERKTHRKLRGIQEAIARNQAFLDAVVDFQDSCSPFPLRDTDERAPGEPSRTTAAQVSKVNTTLRQCMRDWSVEGEEERRQSYGAVIAELERLRPVDPDRKGAQKVLVPGAGEGRLAYEIVSRGYGCAGTLWAVSPYTPDESEVLVDLSWGGFVPPPERLGGGFNGFALDVLL